MIISKDIKLSLGLILFLMTLKKAYITPLSGGRQLLIGDIHGCSTTFKALIRKIDLQKNDQLILLGDLINKGPDSKGVLDYIIALKEEGFEVYALRGNMESMLLRILKKNESRNLQTFII